MVLFSFVVLPGHGRKRKRYKPLRHRVVRERDDDREYNNSDKRERKGASLSLQPTGN